MGEQDVIVVGGGAAGLSAAVEAAGAGTRVLVLEACAEPGGAAAVSGGGTFVAGSPLQRALGIEDSCERALEDWQRWGGEEADAAWAERYVRRSREDVYAWLEGLGVVWTQVHLHEGNAVARWHAPRGGGAEVVRRLLAAAQARGVRCRPGARVAALLRDGDAVTGVRLEGGELLHAPAVLVATGGFTGSAEHVARFGPDPGPGGRVLLGGGRSATGDGLGLLQDVGAAFARLDRLWLYPYGTPDDTDPSGRRGMAVRGIRNEIWVNAAGRRFHDENARGGATGTRALLAQRPATCWSIFDAEEATRLTLTHPGYGTDEEPDRAAVRAFLERSPHAHSAATLEELARRAGLPGEQLAATVQTYNDAFARDPPGDEHGRDLAGLRPIDRRPYVALRYFPMARKCLGGVRTDLACRVRGADGAAIAGLFAAGEVAGMAGGHINGRAALEGTMFGPSIFSGRVAGRAMAAMRRGEPLLTSG
jgi:predicted oxidoreductase